MVGRPRRDTQRHPHGRAAMYLGGYAVECKLKAILMEMHRCITLSQLIKRLDVDERDVYTHGFDALGKHLPRLFTRMRQISVWSDYTHRVNQWKPSWRYNPADPFAGEADLFVSAIERVYRWLDNNRG